MFFLYFFEQFISDLDFLSFQTSTAGKKNLMMVSESDWIYAQSSTVNLKTLFGITLNPEKNEASGRSSHPVV